MLQLTDWRRWEEVDASCIVFILFYQVEGIFLSIQFDNSDPLVGLLLSVAVGALAFDFQLLLQRKLFYLLRRS